MNGFSAVALAALVFASQVFAEGPGAPQGDLESVQAQIQALDVAWARA